MDVKDPPAEPEVASLQEIEKEMPEAGPVRGPAETDPVQEPMPAYGPAWEARPEEGPVTAEREAQDAGPAVQVQEGEVPQEDMGAGALPPGPVLPKDEAVLPGDVMPFPPVPVLPANETVLPADEMPFPPVLA